MTEARRATPLVATASYRPGGKRGKEGEVSFVQTLKLEVAVHTYSRFFIDVLGLFFLVGNELNARCQYIYISPKIGLVLFHGTYHHGENIMSSSIP